MKTTSRVQLTNFAFAVKTWVKRRLSSPIQDAACGSMDLRHTTEPTQSLCNPSAKGPRGKSACLHSPPNTPPLADSQDLEGNTVSDWKTSRFHTAPPLLCSRNSSLWRCDYGKTRMRQCLMWGKLIDSLKSVIITNALFFADAFCFSFCPKMLSKTTKYGSLSFEHIQLHWLSQTSCCKNSECTSWHQSRTNERAGCSLFA